MSISYCFLRNAMDCNFKNFQENSENIKLQNSKIYAKCNEQKPLENSIMHAGHKFGDSILTIVCFSQAATDRREVTYGSEVHSSLSLAVGTRFFFLSLSNFVIQGFIAPLELCSKAKLAAMRRLVAWVCRRGWGREGASSCWEDAWRRDEQKDWRPTATGARLAPPRPRHGN